ncbi:MAG: methyltransferase domain-containing protein [Gemmatimonadales bacterium]|nr:methyltransferase domain-containing protein [Gemmatimonadales bacterium]NIN12960.1 methyltransferase domain-containing protein [Gemmatimonadales bacterium]NIR02635.1 methyltransferase domain-containing protein [Gemmatimonadales bacterium]NIS67211.1 methyltransferase domain-containing protein [Gemmatimonadales bacterium]
MNPLDRLARRALRGQLARLRYGSVELRESGAAQRFGRGREAAVAITVRDPRFYRAVVLGGHVGAAEAYVAEWWTADDLTALVRLFVRNRAVLDGMEKGWARMVQPVRRLWHRSNRNTRRGSRRNIAAHYDLGNDFYSLFLDDTLTYSCGIFESPDSTLREASIAKYDRLCRKLALAPEDHVIEIGTGWGGFALHAARHYGCRVTTTTISREQATLAEQRIRAAGLSGRVTVLREDYRDLRGGFDKLVSIEMIEAVGHEYYRTFFEKCASLLVPHGLMALQAITIQDRDYERARREVDFIKRYIFPGSTIPSISVLATAASHTDLRIVGLEDITLHYAETLRRWRSNFTTNWPRIRELGFSEQFRRLWEFYFCYCEGGFREGALGDVQLVLAKPRAIASGSLRHEPRRMAVA